MTDVTFHEPDDVEAFGFAKFNSGEHMCVLIPDGHSTISARLSDGTRVTFAFVPYREGKVPCCVDVQVHDGATFTSRDGREHVRQSLIAFGAGPTYYRSDRAEDARDDVTLTTHLLPQHHLHGDTK